MNGIASERRTCPRSEGLLRAGHPGGSSLHLAGSSWSSWNDGNRLAIAHGKPGECALRQALPLPDSRSIAGSDVIAVCSSLHAKRQTAESGFRSRPLPAPDVPVTRADGAASRRRTPTAPRRRRAWRDGPARLPEPAPPRGLPRVCPPPRLQHPAAGPRIVASLAIPRAVSRPRSLPRLPQPSSAVHANRGAPAVMPEQLRLWRVTDCRLAGKATTLPVGPACREKESEPQAIHPSGFRSAAVALGTVLHVASGRPRSLDCRAVGCRTHRVRRGLVPSAVPSIRYGVSGGVPPSPAAPAPQQPQGPLRGQRASSRGPGRRAGGCP